MTIGIYNSCIENRMLGDVSAATIAAALSTNQQVELISQANRSAAELESLGGASLQRVGFRICDNAPQCSSDPGRPGHRYQALRNWSEELTERYDLFINFADRLPIFCSAPRGVLCIQFPHDFIPSFYRSFWHEHLGTYQLKLVNSYYTQFWTRVFWDIDCLKLYAPVKNQSLPAAKENLIISAGTFNPHRGHRQLELVSAFKELKNRLPTWSLVIVGELDQNTASIKYLERVSQTATESGISVLSNPSFEQQQSLLRRAKIFWHAGLPDLDTEPQPNVEPFNITMVQAMSAGCIPVVSNSGAAAEVIKHGEDGLLWQRLEQMIEYSVDVGTDAERREKLARNSRKRALRFRPENYKEAFLNHLQKAFGSENYPNPRFPGRWHRLISRWIS